MLVETPIPVVLVVQNQGVPQDVRVTGFAHTLAKAGYSVEIIAPARRDQPMAERIDGSIVYRFHQPPEGPGTWGYAREVGASLWRIMRTRQKLRLRGRWRILHLCSPPD